MPVAEHLPVQMSHFGGVPLTCSMEFKSGRKGSSLITVHTSLASK
jgi:hypothetical protein